MSPTASTRTSSSLPGGAWRAAALFAGVAAVLFLLQANRFEVTNDEGIILQAARRMANGQRLYVDFWGYMAPGGTWLQEAVFRLFGVKMWTARLPVILDFSLQAALLFWLTRRLASEAVAWAAAVLFFCAEVTLPGFLTAQHRWDSGALSLASIIMAVHGADRRSRAWLAGAGATIAAATFFTPTVGLLAAVTGIWLLAARQLRRLLVAYVAAGIGMSLLVFAVMYRQGILVPFVEQMLWLRSNYSGVNVMPYGSIIGGYGRLFAGISWAELIPRVSIVAVIALPAILPVIALLGWAVAWTTGRARALSDQDRLIILCLLACIAGLVASTYPRADVMHLAFVAPLSYAVVSALFYRFAPGAKWVYVYLLLWAVVLTGNHLVSLRSELPVSSPVGELTAPGSCAAPLRRLLRTVQPGDGLFVYPYMPVLYFVTEAENPTRFSYLGPGMMTREDELNVLESLRARPPEWVLRLSVDREQFLAIWPSAKGLDHRFELIEQWISKSYEPLDEPLAVAGYRLLRRTDRTR